MNRSPLEALAAPAQPKGGADILPAASQAGSLCHPLPPRLTMAEYGAFVQASLDRTDPGKAARQKAIEERIVVPFRIAPPEP